MLRATGRASWRETVDLGYIAAMPTLVYAVFDDASAADGATSALTRVSGEFPAFLVQHHTRGPLDGGDLPEVATEIWRNTIIGTIFGGFVGMTLGLLAATVLGVMGLPPALGAIMGLITGVMFGMMRGLMAGTRVPKQALREVAAGLEDGAVLLTIEVLEHAHVEHVEEVLDSHGAAHVDRC